MVLIEESSGTAAGSKSADQQPTTPTSSSSSNGASPSSSSSSTANTSGGGSASATAASAAGGIGGLVSGDKIGFLLFLTRLVTVVFTFLFIIPISGYDAPTLYHKALMAGAATSALKLHQRMSGVPFQLNRVYFGSLMIEDSFHYLLYALIFLNSFPITVVLMPISAFALLHVSAYVKNLLSAAGVTTGPIRRLTDVVCTRDKDIMRFVAVTEIMLGPTIIFMILSGKAGIFVPFIYYRFICMRYQSRRNPYSRIMFYELRVTIEHYSSQTSCPQFVRSGVQRLIALVSRMAPQPNTV